MYPRPFLFSDLPKGTIVDLREDIVIPPINPLRETMPLSYSWNYHTRRPPSLIWYRPSMKSLLKSVVTTLIAGEHNA